MKNLSDLGIRIESKHQQYAWENKILMLQTGSHLYGTNTPTSDVDYAGIFIPSIENLLGMNKIEQVDMSFISKRADGKNAEDAIDCTLYNIQKYVHLAAIKNNPNILEQLFVNDDNLVFCNDIGRKLLDNRHLFPFKGCYNSFIGYAFSQRKKMVIKLENYESFKEAQKYLHALEGKNKLVVAELKHMNGVPKCFQFKNDQVKIGDTRCPTSATIKRLTRMIDERVERVGNRRELVEQFGYDTKFASHLIRLLKEGAELLSTGEVIFPLQYADEILDIKKGKYKLQEVIDYSETLEDKMREVEKKSDLPSKPRFKEVNKFLVETLSEFIVKNTEYWKEM